MERKTNKKKNRKMQKKKCHGWGLNPQSSEGVKGGSGPDLAYKPLRFKKKTKRTKTVVPLRMGRGLNPQPSDEGMQGQDSPTTLSDWRENGAYSKKQELFFL